MSWLCINGSDKPSEGKNHSHDEALSIIHEVNDYKHRLSHKVSVNDW